MRYIPRFVTIGIRSQNEALIDEEFLCFSALIEREDASNNVGQFH